MAILKPFANGLNPLKNTLYLSVLMKTVKSSSHISPQVVQCRVLFRDTCKQMRAHTWAQMKAQLAVRFSDVTHNQMALSLLRQVRQKAGENIQNYAERILSLADEAYDRHFC